MSDCCVSAWCVHGECMVSARVLCECMLSARVLCQFVVSARVLWWMSECCVSVWRVIRVGHGNWWCVATGKTLKKFLCSPLPCPHSCESYKKQNITIKNESNKCRNKNRPVNVRKKLGRCAMAVFVTRNLQVRMRMQVRECECVSV